MAKAKKAKDVKPFIGMTLKDAHEKIVMDKVKDDQIPYAVRRELEQITKNSGRVFDLSRPLNELEEICNDANQPRGAWRDRWQADNS